MIDSDLLGEAETLLGLVRSRGVMLATAESCTGGLIAAVLTAIPGASDVVERGFVTYSNAAKTELLGVPAGLIASLGAVSAEVAQAMAEGAIRASAADLALSVTGVAGPGGGTEVKPVGLVFLGLARRNGATVVERQHFPGDRTAVRLASVRAGFALLRSALQA